ncbi:MAG: XRE family transcriptional regulator [Magnetococcus sp. YQC-5]
MTFNERLKASRKHARLTQKELADRVGLSETAIHKLESGKNKISRYTVSIALTCGVDPIWLETGRGEMALGGITPEEVAIGGIYRQPVLARLPLISWEEANRLCVELIESFHPTADAWLPIAPKGSEHTFALRVPDDSMLPEFREGEFIVVDPTLPGKHNRFVVACAEGDTAATFKQLMVTGSKTYLKPLNTRYPLMEVQGVVKVCGVVVGKYKEY